MTEMSEAFSVEGLSAGYGSVTVLHDISLQCRKGAVLGISGPNGAGKSTLLNALIGTVSSSSRGVRLHGDDLSGRAPHDRVRRGLGLVPEGRQIIGALTVAQNLDITVMAHGRLRVGPDHRARREEVLSLFPRLGERLHVRGLSLSGGEQQMLAIARALMTGPRVLMLDEPSQGLAVDVVETVVNALGKLRGQLTMVIVEQNPEILTSLADQVLSLSMGRMQPGDE